ncbi:uncharacterized protein Dwil_GK24962 [Drosophila willistoni]|uniref:Uncharacterized protein n=1 Tax=Drosophila willistoni TaxID=7260 RepID=B4ND74_DROWI|nr:uncharacterized protein Dwil_GK24962 [Drosophila willistoni]
MITLSMELVLGLVLLLGVAANGQQLFLMRPQRSLYEAPSLGWNTIGSFGGINPIGLGHMSKDELITLLDAWREVEEEMVIAPQIPPPGAPVTVRLPAFVPVQLAAMWTPPLGGVAAAAGGVAAAGAGAGVTEAANAEVAASRLFRFMPLPVMAGSARSRPPAQQQVKNTLDSIEAELSAPAPKLVKPKPKTTLPQKPKLASASSLPPSFRPRFGLPPYLANAPGRLELVPSSQIIGDWRE